MRLFGLMITKDRTGVPFPVRRVEDLFAWKRVLSLHPDHGGAIIEGLDPVGGSQWIGPWTESHSLGGS